NRGTRATRDEEPERDDHLIGAMLRQAGYQVCEAQSGAHAVRAATDRPDLVVRCVDGHPAVAPVLELSAGDRGPGEGVDARVSLPVPPGSSHRRSRRCCAWIAGG